MPEVIFAADGGAAERMIPRIREAVRGYAFQEGSENPSARYLR